MDGATGPNCGVRIEDLAMLCKPLRVVLIPLELEDQVHFPIDGNISEEERNKAIETKFVKNKYTKSKTKRGKNKKSKSEYVEYKLNATERRIIQLIEANNFENYEAAYDYEQNVTLPKTKRRKNMKKITKYVECKLNDTERRIVKLVEANNFEDYDRPLPPPLSFPPNNLQPEPNCATTTEVCIVEPGVEVTRKIYQFQCRYCEAKFFRPANLKDHERTHNEYVSEDESGKPGKKSRRKPSTLCTQCDDALDGPLAIKAHQLFHEEGVEFTCQLCRFGFENNRAWKYHNKTKHNDKYNYVCEFCGARFKVRNVWRTHLRIHATNKTFVCQKCGASFLTPFRLATHEKIHNKSKDFKCDFCEESFYTRRGLGIHALQYHERVISTSLPRDSLLKRHNCKVCGKSFTRVDGLRLHSGIHTGDMPHECQYCHRRFPNKPRLERHFESAHGGESVKVQCEHCGKLCKNKDSLAHHVKYQHSAYSEAQVVCDICGKMILTKRLRDHKISHGEETLKCNQCSFVTNRARLLMAHNFKHSKEKRFRCNSCTASYRTSITLKKHKLTHNDNGTNDSNSSNKN